MKPTSGQQQDLGDGWVGQFDYTVTSRGWVPVSLRVWHQGEEMPSSGLPVRRLRRLTVAADLAALGEAPGAPIQPLDLTPAQRRTASGRLRTLQVYDAMRFSGLTRGQVAERLHVSEAWLKWVLSWGRREGYLDKAGDLTETFALEFVRSQAQGE